MTHKGTVTLETERLILRRFTLDDAEAMFRNWCNDPDVTKWLMWEPHASVDVTHEILDRWVAAYENADNYQWAIVPRDLNEPIGDIAVVKSDDRYKMVHIGYCIGKPWWRKGYMSEALARLVRFFFEDVGVNRVEAVHAPDNPNSGRVMQKAGLRFERLQRQAGFLPRHGIIDKVSYALLAEDYFSAKQGIANVTAESYTERNAEITDNRTDEGYNPDKLFVIRTMTIADKFCKDATIERLDDGRAYHFDTPRTVDNGR
jgi:ribosomal-protein-alanine N-acetyltransferase